MRHLHRDVHVLVDDLRDVDRPLHRLDLRHVHRHLDHVLHLHVDDLRHRNLPHLLHGLDLDLRNVHVAGIRNLLDLDHRHVADHFLDMRDLDRDVLDLDLRNLQALE